MKLGLIGAGGMAATMLEAIAAHEPRLLDHLAVLVRDRAKGEALVAAQGSCARVTSVHTEIEDFLHSGAGVVCECAGHGAVREHGAAVLKAGRDLVIASTGALADASLLEALKAAAVQGGAQMLLPAGAVGGIDALAAARLLGTPRVTYIGRKPPRAWKGTKAEALVALDALTEATTFYEGAARDAARDFPQNANVAATIALAGVGFEATRVRLVADPTISANVHELEVESDAVRFSIRLVGVPSRSNPKTSLTAGLSMARAVLNRDAVVVV
ncbi:aspartate dehydrogenase [Falsiroseomonas bella]|uniref:L-aspartate dehydrogenase n=1 Tax=Falsiroseomonas bella TaxID=2184016 RepID=A0A317FHB8_9PROT|nr:aspartate dehydrogenase [Falsiroseomonas bella]PWS38460.1 aspartate dehydrogenase [Falsiroseomonas bella]